MSFIIKFSAYFQFLVLFWQIPFSTLWITKWKWNHKAACIHCHSKAFTLIEFIHWNVSYTLSYKHLNTCECRQTYHMGTSIDTNCLHDLVINLHRCHYLYRDWVCRHQFPHNVVRQNHYNTDTHTLPYHSWRNKYLCRNNLHSRHNFRFLWWPWDEHIERPTAQRQLKHVKQKQTKKIKKEKKRNDRY